MKNPIPIDELPSFKEKVTDSNIKGSNPMLNLLIVGGLLIIGATIYSSLVKNARQKLHQNNSQ